MKRLAFVTTSIASLFLAQAAMADKFCEVRTYAPGLSAAKGGRTQALKIIKSWIPEQFIVTEDALQFGEDFFIEIESNTSQKIRASYHTKDTAGKRHYVVYEVVYRENETIANVTVQQNRYRPLGPVIFDCEDI